MSHRSNALGKQPLLFLAGGCAELMKRGFISREGRRLLLGTSKHSAGISTWVLRSKGKGTERESGRLLVH